MRWSNYSKMLFLSYCLLTCLKSPFETLCFISVQHFLGYHPRWIPTGDFFFSVGAGGVPGILADSSQCESSTLWEDPAPAKETRVTTTSLKIIQIKIEQDHWSHWFFPPINSPDFLFYLSGLIMITYSTSHHLLFEVPTNFRVLQTRIMFSGYWSTSVK